MRIRCLSRRLTKDQQSEIGGSLKKPSTEFNYEITVGKEYVVLAMSFSINTEYINGIQFDICSDSGMISTIPMCLFEIVDNKISKFWKTEHLGNYFILQPQEFLQKYFYDHLTDGYPEYLKTFKYVVAYMESEFLRDDDLLRRLLKRADSLKTDSRVELSDEEMNIIESELGTILPGDFKALSKFYRYDIFQSFNFFIFFDKYDFKEGVVKETLYYREYSNLRSNYIVLCCDYHSFIVLDAKEDGMSEVIRCSHDDFLNLCDNLPVQYNPTIFPTFADFYEFLLDEEEKMRKEEGNS